jgi:DNA-binding transcriptional ArsR family regulator
MRMRADMRVFERSGELGPEQVEVAVSTLSLLAEPTRVRLLWCLLRGEFAVSELSVMTGAAPSAVSQHLAKLRLARLVKHRRAGRRILYSADNSHVHRLLEEALYHADHVAQGHADHP